MYPLLSNINKYVEENGIIKSAIYINAKRLPKYIVQVAVNELSKTGDACMIDDTCILAYDKEGKLSLILTFNDGTKRLVITDSKEPLHFPDKNFKFSKMRSDTVYKKAKKLEYIDFIVNSSFDDIYSKYIMKYRNKIAQSTTKEGRDKAIKMYNYKTREVKSILRDEINILIDNGHIKEFKTMVSSVDHELSLFEEAAKQYISYLNNEHLNIMKNECIYFDKDKTHNTKVKSHSGQVHNDGRKNSILPFEFREEAIKVLKPTMIVKGQENVVDDKVISASDVVYYSYLVDLGNNEYKLIIEPFNGTKYTKVAYFTYDGEMSYDKFKEIVTDYLTMSEKEVIDSKSMIRLGHTSDENYLASVWYTVTRDNELKVNPNIIEKVNKLVPDTYEKAKTL